MWCGAGIAADEGCGSQVNPVAQPSQLSCQQLCGGGLGGASQRGGRREKGALEGDLEDCLTACRLLSKPKTAWESRRRSAGREKKQGEGQGDCPRITQGIRRASGTMGIVQGAGCTVLNWRGS